MAERLSRPIEALCSDVVVAVIVPAYNEVGRIGAVLKVLTEITFLDEVVVVDDGSADGTAEEASSFGVKVLRQTTNLGKGAALQHGFECIDADVYLTIDADLVGLTVQHIEQLLRPILEDPDLMMTVGKFKGGRLLTDLAQHLVPTISGQRGLRASFVRALPPLADSGFAVEVLITRAAEKEGAKVQEVELQNITQVMKEEKLGFVAGMRFRMKMYREMLTRLFRPV